MGWRASVSVLVVLLVAPHELRGEAFAWKVTDFVVGQGAAPGFDQADAALGSPTRLTGVGVFPGVVSAFNPPYLPSEIVSIGEGGMIELRLSHYIIPTAPGRDLGVFVNVGLIDNDYPHGLASNPLSATSGTFSADAAVLEVSPNGLDWTSLGAQLFDVPTIGYSDVTNPFAETAGSMPSDFGLPYHGALSDLAGLRYHDPAATDMLDHFAGSGGGTWLDLAATDLSFIGYLRFSVPDDGDPNTSLKFELDAVSVAHTATGPAVPEPSALPLALAGVATLLTARRGRRA